MPANPDERFAVKLQSKYQLVKQKQEPHLFHEISIMGQMDHPFILKLNGVSQDKRLVYMFTEYMVCGDLMATVNKFKQLSAHHARFYAAQVVDSLEYMHGRDFIYRDLKPENVLLCPNGYIKLADFGFVKKLPKYERCMTFCGTPEYMAPEIIQNKSYGHAVDWYAVGIFLYELIYGRPPFMASDPYKIFERVLNEKLRFPVGFDKAAKSLIKHLCAHDLSKRYGNLHGGVDDIKRHRFFADFDWQKLRDMRMPVYYTPVAKAKADGDEVEAGDLEESRDNTKFPPIKESKDPFLAWF